MTTTEPLRENDVKDTAMLVSLMMVDQQTDQSFGTFHAWLSAECLGIQPLGVRNMWRYVHAQTSRPYPDGSREEATR